MRAALLCLLSAACAVDIETSTSALTTADVWPQLGYDPAHRGVNPNETILDPETVADLRLAWAAPTGLRPGGPIVATARAYVGSENNTLYALQATTGRRLWRAFAGNDVRGTPGAAYGRVYFVANDGYLYAVTARTGDVEWRANVRPYPTAPVDRPLSPVLHQGVVYVAVGPRLFAFAADGCGASTCAPRWYADTPILLGSWQVTPTVGKGHVFVVGATPGTSERIDLYAFSLAGCAASPCGPTWVRTLVSTTSGYVLPYTLVYNGGRVYVPTNVALYSVWADTGVQRWARALGCLGPPALANAVAYVPTTTGLFALDEASGRTRWRSPVASGPAWPPAVANGVVYAGLGDAGRLAAFAADCGTGGATCAPVWTDTVDGTRDQPAVAGGMVFVGNEESNELRALAP